MAIIYGKNTAVDYAAGNLASFGKSYSRMGAAPLDMYEVWYDYDKLVEYASYRGNDAAGNKVYDNNTEVVDTSAVTSYVGQKVAYVDDTNGKIYHYSIELDGSLKEIGVAPRGDGKSVSVSAEGVVSLLGVDTADSLTLPRMKEDKSGIEWVPVSAVVQGDGNDNTTYTFTPITKGEGEAAETYGFIVKTFFNDTEVEGGEFTFSFDVYTKSEVDAAIKEVADLVGVPAEDDDSTDTLYERVAAEILRATNAESALSDRIGLAKDGETAATGVYAYVDGVVNALVNGVDPDKIDSLNELIAWVEAHPDIVSGLDERLIAAENKLAGIGGEEEPATVIEAIGDAISAHEGVADGKYATKQEIANAGYAVAADVVDNDTFEEFKTANSKAIKDAVAAHETAVAGTYATKEELKATDDVAKDAQNRVGIVEGKIDEITSVGGEPNVIEKIKVNGVTLEVEKDAEGKSTKTVSIAVPTSIVGMGGYSDLDGRVTKNADDVLALQGQLGTTNTNVSGLTDRLAALETEVGEVAESRIDALEGVTSQHTKDISANTSAISVLNTTTIPALEQAVSNEVKARDDADKAINAKIGEVAEGKTLVDMINAVAGTIDFTPYAKKDEVANTYATIEALENIYKVTGEGEEAVATGILAEEIARAKAAEQKISGELALLIENPTEALDSVKELITHVQNNGAAVAGIITRLDDHDDVLAGIGGEGQKPTVKQYVDDAITAAAYELPAATAEVLGGVKSAANDAEGNVAVNKVYIDASTNVGEVKAFSTDNLVQGKFTLVLNGGDAEVSAE